MFNQIKDVYQSKNGLQKSQKPYFFVVVKLCCRNFKSNHFNIPLDALNSGNVLIQKHDIYLDLNR